MAQEETYAEVSTGVFKAFTQNLTNLGKEEVCMDHTFYHLRKYSQLSS